MALTKQARRLRVKKRVRKKISGTPERPRLSVFRSNKHIYGQLIDDEAGQTLVAFSTRNKEVAEQAAQANKSDQAEMVGKYLAQRCQDKGITQAVFDRNGYRYHGRIRRLAEAARKEGLKL